MNIESGRITGQQLMFLITGYIQGSIVLVSYTSGLTKQDSWLVVLASLLVTLPLAASWGILARRFSGKNLMLINETVYGRFVGVLVSLIYIYFFTLILAFTVAELSNFYTTYMMPDTPRLLFIVALTLVCMYATAKGIEAIGRISHLLVILISTIIVVTFVFLIPVMRLSNFLPVFDIPLKAFVEGVHITSVIPFGDWLPLLVVMAYVRDSRSLPKYAALGLSWAGLSLFLVPVRNTAVLGNTEAITLSPSFQATRLIDIGMVLTRMDLLIGVGQTAMIFLKACLLYYAVVLCWAHLLRLRTYIPLVLPLAGIMIVLSSVVWETSIDPMIASKGYQLLFNTPIIFLFPPLTLLIAAIRGLPKKGGDTR